MIAIGPSGGREIHLPHLAITPTRRQVASLGVGAAGLAAYNWWVLVPFRHGLMPSTDGFFSDLEVSGRPDAALMSHLDLAAGLLIVAALVLSGPARDRRPRREWLWLVGFGLAGATGGTFHYACSEGLSASCRQAERNLQLPPHHYVHMVAGIVEFATITLAARRAERRTRSGSGPVTEAYRLVALLLVVGYPMLAVAYLSDRMGAYVEPIFFVAFSLLLLTALLEPLTLPPSDAAPEDQAHHHSFLAPLAALGPLAANGPLRVLLPMAARGHRRDGSMRPARWSAGPAAARPARAARRSAPARDDRCRSGDRPTATGPCVEADRRSAPPRRPPAR